MTASEVLKEEEITLTYDTWTFDPSIVTQSHQDDEGFLSFPEEVDEVFRDHGYTILARTMEIFEATEVDGKAAYVSTGTHPIAIVLDCFEEDAYYVDEESVDYQIVLPGEKVLFVTDEVLLFPGGADRNCLLRYAKSEDED